MSLNPDFVYLFHINILSIYSASRHGLSGTKIQIIYFFLGKEVFKFILANKKHFEGKTFGPIFKSKFFSKGAIIDKL